MIYVLNYGIMTPHYIFCVFNSYTMGTSGLPDIYTQSLRAEVYISGKPPWYNCYVTLYFNVNGFTVFIVVIIAFDCGFRL